MDPHSMSNHTLVDSVRSATQLNHEVHESWIKHKTIEPQVNPYTPIAEIEVETPM
jgi:hypothetical protein